MKRVKRNRTSKVRHLYNIMVKTVWPDRFVQMYPVSDKTGWTKKYALQRLKREGGVRETRGLTEMANFQVCRKDGPVRITRKIFKFPIHRKGKHGIWFSLRDYLKRTLRRNPAGGKRK